MPCHIGKHSSYFVFILSTLDTSILNMVGAFCGYAARLNSDGLESCSASSVCRVAIEQ